MPSAYLTGLLCARLATEKRIKSCVLDVGLVKPLAGSRIFAVLKGAIDGGLEIPHSEDSLPPEDRLRGVHIANYAAMLKSDKKQHTFSEYTKKGLDPKDMPKHFDIVKTNIMKGSKKPKTTKPKTTKPKKKRASKSKSPSS